MSIIDWKKCFYSSADSIIKDIAKLYNDGKTIKEICEIYNTNFPFVSQRLLFASEIGLCDYKKNDYEKIICLEDGMVFNSENSASRYYNISHSCIHNGCVGISKNGVKTKDGNYLHFLFYKDYLEKCS